MYSTSDQRLGIPFPSNPQLGSLSPYLNFDPAYVTQQGPEYIFPEGASRQRGRFELAFSQIGGSVMLGGLVGGVAGLRTGLIETKLAQNTGSVWRTQMLNHISKSGSGIANTCGTIAVMYSGFGVLLSLARGTDDELNTLAAGTMTGLLYRSSVGLRKCAIGGAFGLGLSAAWVLIFHSDRIKDTLQRNHA